MGLFRRLKAWLFREGDYPSHQVTASPERLAAIVANTNARTLGPKLDLEHGPTENVLDFGRVVPGTLQVEQGAPPGGQAGAWITGDVVVDAAVDDRLKTRGVSILLDANTDTIEKLAVTANPAVTGAQFSTGGTLMKNPLSHLRAFNAEDAAAAAAGSETTQAVTTEADAPTETVSIPAESFIDRIVGGIRSSLGVGNQTPQPAFTGDQATAFTQMQADLAAANQRAQTAERNAQAAFAIAQTQQLAAFRQTELANGVPPLVVDVLAPIAVGMPTAPVAFTNGAVVETRQLSAQQAAAYLIEQMRGAIPMSRLLPNDDSRHLEFNDRVRARADEIRRTDPSISDRDAVIAAAREVK